MKRIAITFLVFVIAACAGGPGVKLEAPAGDPESAANDQTEAAVVATEAPTSQPEEILPGIEVVPISEMAKEIPWLDTDIKAVPMTTFIGINFNIPPFDNPLVRKAFSLAIDRQRISDGEKSRGSATSMPATTFIPPQMLGRDLYSAVGLNFNAEEAKKTLIDAGFSDVGQLPAIEIVFYKGSTDQVNAYKDMWKTALGVDVNLIPVKSGAELYDTIDNQKPGLFILGAWIANYNDPHNFTQDTFLNQESHYPPLAGTAFSGLVSRAEAAANDPISRQKLYIEAEKLLCEQEIYIIPVTHAVINMK